MPRIIRMPTQEELPDGPTRDFVYLLFILYRAAHRPTLDTISRYIRDGDYNATASKETLRKMLRGTTVPAHWQTVEATILALCDLAGWQPDDRITLLHDGMRVDRSVMDHAEERWHQALDEPQRRAPAQTAESTPPEPMDAATDSKDADIRWLAQKWRQHDLGTGMGEETAHSPLDRLPSGHITFNPELD